MIIFTTVLYALISLTNIDLIPKGGGWRERALTLNQSSIVTIDDTWLIPSSLTILHNSDTLRVDIDYALSKSDVSERQSLLVPFSIHLHNLHPGDTLVVRWQSAAVTERMEHYYNLPEPADISDSVKVPVKRKKPLNPLKSWGNIRRSGSITRGIRINENGSGDAVSGLNLELSGRPNPDLFIKAVVDDRDIQVSSTGESARISQLDKLLFQIKTSHLSAEMGDLDLHWDSGKYGDLSGRLKGASLSMEYPSISGSLVGASKNNTFHVVTINGRDGDQGPYELSDKSNRRGVTVVAGSEKVFVDGKELKRGTRIGYTINYRNGQIMFNPSVPINSHTRIEVEYEYSDVSYEKDLYAANVKFPGRMSNSFSVETTTAIERSNSDRVTGFEWNDKWKEAVKNAGDDQRLSKSSGVDSVGVNKGDYVWQDSLGQQILLFSLPDSIGRPTGYLNASFVEDSSGAYDRFFEALLQTFYYIWVGEGEGHYSPYLYLPLPESVNSNNLLMNYKKDNLSISSEIAISQWDKNTLSTLDDADNIGTALQFKASYGADKLDGLSISTSVRHEESQFRTLNRKNRIDHNYQWDLHETLQGAESDVTAKLQYRTGKDIMLDAGGGYLGKGEGYESYRINGGGLISVGEFDIASRYDHVEGINRLTDQNNQRMNLAASIKRKSGTIQPQYSFKYEDRMTDEPDAKSTVQYWEQGIGASVKLNPSQQVGVNYRYRRDNGTSDRQLTNQSDTRVIQMNWKGRKPGLGGWTSDFLFHNQSFSDRAKLLSSSSNINAFLRPTQSPISGRFSYALSTGSQGSALTVARYVGDGNGNYKREGNRYVPDPEGNFVLDEVITDSVGWVTNINSSVQFEWKPLTSRKNSPVDRLPFGFSGLLTRIESDLSTSDMDSWRGYFLDPASYRNAHTIRSDWRFFEELSFQSKKRRSDSRISFRYGELRDKYLSGGESRNDMELSGNFRHKWTDRIISTVKPSWEVMKRVGTVHDDQRANLTEYKGEIGYRVLKVLKYLELGSNFRYEYRHDAVTGNRVDERVVIVPISWTMKQSGILRMEGRWHKLTASRPSPGYDLTRGWLIGDNYNTTLTLHQQLKSGLKVSVMYRGRWRSTLPPRHTGQIEMTASF